jgi:hypothetical protein
VDPGGRPAGTVVGEEPGDPAGEILAAHHHRLGAGHVEEFAPAPGELGGHRVRRLSLAGQQPLGRPPELGERNRVRPWRAELVEELPESGGVGVGEHGGDPAGGGQQDPPERSGDRVQDRAAEGQVDVAGGVLVAQPPPGVHLAGAPLGGRARDGGELAVERRHRGGEPVRVAGRGGDLGPGGVEPVQAGQRPFAGGRIREPGDGGPQRVFGVLVVGHVNAPPDDAAGGKAFEQRGLPRLDRGPPVASREHRELLAGHRQRRLRGAQHVCALDGQVRRDRDRQPGADGRVGGERGGVRLKRPELVVHLAGAGEAGPGVHDDGGCRGVEPPPGDRAEEPDRVVLAAVALPVLGGRVLAVAPLHPPARVLLGVGLGQVPQDLRDRRVLPGDGLAEQRVLDDRHCGAARLGERVAERGGDLCLADGPVQEGVRDLGAVRRRETVQAGRGKPRRTDQDIPPHGPGGTGQRNRMVTHSSLPFIRISRTFD